MRFDQLSQRVRALTTLYKAIQTWAVHGYNDEKLIDALHCFAVLEPCMADSALCLCGPLQIIKLRARMYTSSMTKRRST